MSYVVTIGVAVKSKVEDCVFWLMSHYLDEYGSEYAEKMIGQIQQEIEELMGRLSKMPRIYESVIDSNPIQARGHTVHDGRYLIVWEIHEASKTIVITDFRDLKYPEKYQFTEVVLDD